MMRSGWLKSIAVVLVCAYVIAVGLFVGQTHSANAAIPKYINFQGKLTAVSNGNNVANGSYTVEFKLYAASSGGSPLWTETWDGSPAECPELAVAQGVFNAKLGSCEPLTSVDFTAGSLYLTINVEADGEMSPRKQLVSSAYSFVANAVSGDGKVNVTTGQSTTALTVARSGTDYALQVDTNTASSATGLKVTAAAAGGGLALATISSGSNENLTLDAKGSGTVSIGATSTGSILFAGGSGSTGCTITTSGALTCDGNITGPSTGSVGYWSRSGTTVQPATAGDNITTSGNISTTSSGTITSAGTLTASNGLTLTTGALSLTSTSGAAALTLSSSTTAFNVNSGLFDIDTTNSRVGVGTASPNNTFTVSLPAVGSNSYMQLSSATASAFNTYFGTTASNQYAWFTNTKYNGSSFVRDDATKNAWRMSQIVDSNDLFSINHWDTSNTLTNNFTIGGDGAFMIGKSTALTAPYTSASIVGLSSGNIGIGDVSPAALLTVGSGDLFQVNSSGAIAAVVGITNTGAQNTTVQSATALTVARSGSNYALQVDTNTASSATGLKITSAAAAGGLALAVISSGTDENLTIDAKGAGTVSIGATSTGSILFAGGSGSTGCTITTSGALTCDGAGAFSNFSGSSSGTNTGDITLTTIGATPNANGATLTGQVLNLQPADASFGGVVTTTTQTFAGAKTFTSDITIIKNDASILFTDADSDTDFWAGVVEDGGNDDDDIFQIGDGTTTGTNPFLTINTSGNVGIGDTSPNSLFTVGSGDLFQINTSGQIGSQQSPVSDYLFALAGTTGNDNSRIIDITQANDANESSSVINIANTASGTGSLSISNIAQTLTPTATVSGGDSIVYRGINNTVTATGLTLTTGASGIDLYGSSNTVSGTPILNSGVGGDTILAYGISSSVGVSPTLTSVSAGSVLTTYGAYLYNYSASAGNANLANTAYGLYADANGNLSTTGTTTHYGGYFTASGTAVTNYGLYATVTGGTTNYAAILTGGNVGIGTTAPGRALEVNDASGNNLRLTYNDSDGSPTNYVDLLTTSGGNLTVVPSGGTASITGIATISSILQVGSATATTYSRLGTGTTNHSLDAANDLLITDDLEVDGDSFFDGNVTIVGTCTGCGGGGAWDTIGDPSGNGAINMGTTVQTLDWGATTTTDNLTVTSSATGLTSGSAFKVTSATTGAVTNGIVQLLASGNYSGTGGLLNATGSASTAGTLVNFTNNTASYTGNIQAISMTGQTTGTGLSITGGGANLNASGELIDLQMGAATVGSGLNITTSGVYTGAGILQMTANSATTGVIQQITANGLSTGSMLSLSSSGTAGATGQKGINVALSGNNASGSQTTYGGYFSNTHGGSGTNVALYATATTGTNNYAAIFDAGNVGIGTSSPAAKLTVDSNSNSSSVRILGATEGTEIADIYVAASGRLLFDTTAGSAGQGFIEFKGEDDEYGTIIRDSTGVSTGYANLYMNDTTNDYLNVCLNCTNAGATGLVVYDAGSGVMRVGVGTTGPDRKLDVLDASNPQIRLTQADGSVYADLQSTTTANLILTGDSLTASSGLEYGMRITPTVNQSSSASYRALDVNVTETAATTGNGLNRLLDLRVSDSSKLAVSNTGSLTLQNASYITTPFGGFGKYENHLVRSEAFDNASWTKTNVTAPTADTQTAPDGSATAESLATSSSGGDVCQFTSTAPGSDTFTFSVWARSTSGTQSFDMRIDAGATSCATANSTTGTAVTHTATTSWQRFTVTQTFSGASNFVKARIFPGGTGGSGTVYAWGAQMDKASVPGTYAKTTSAALTNDSSRGMIVNTNLKNTTASGYVYGSRNVNIIDSTTAGTHVGQFIRMVDNTSLDSGQTVRGLEVQAYSGTNVNGTNTAIASYGYTFGIQATTTAQAAAQAAPAAVFADLDNGTDATTKARGNAIRAYTDNATSADMVYIYQETSTYTGNALLMDLGNGGGSFASGNFINLKNAGTSKYTISSAGRHDLLAADADNIIPLYINTEESTVSQSVFSIESDSTGNGQSADTVKAHFEADGSLFISLPGTQNTTALCHSSAGQANNDEIVDCSGAPSDVAEYFGSDDPTLTVGEVVVVGRSAEQISLDGYHTSKAWVARSTGAYQDTIMGVVSTAPAVAYGDEIFAPHENPRPIALAGRVPVKVSNENGVIEPGDFLTSSSTPGVAMKATKAGPVIGQALESFSGGSGKIEVFVKASNYSGARIESELAGLIFDYSNSEQTVQASSQILEHLLAQLPNLDYDNLSQVQTDLVVAGAEVITPNVTTKNLRTDFLSSATADGGLEVASVTMFNGGLQVDSIRAIGDLLSFNSDVEFFGTPYFTSDTAGFAVVKAGAQSVDVTFGREYLAQPIVSASISFEQDVDQTSLSESAREELRNNAVAAAQQFLSDPTAFVITNKSKFGFTIVLNKPATQDIKLSWTALAVKNASTFMSLDAPRFPVSPDDGSVAGENTGGSSDNSDAPSQNDPQDSVANPPTEQPSDPPVESP